MHPETRAKGACSSSLSRSWGLDVPSDAMPTGLQARHTWHLARDRPDRTLRRYREGRGATVFVRAWSTHRDPGIGLEADAPCQRSPKQSHPGSR
jgi:hypothetical protein